MDKLSPIVKLLLVGLLVTQIAARCVPGVGEGFPPETYPPGGDGDADGDTDADSDGDGDTDTDSDPFCPGEIEDPCTSDDSPGTIVDADELGEGIRLVSMSRNVLLAEHTVGPHPAPVVFSMDFSAGFNPATLGIAQLAAPPTSPIQPIAVAAGLIAPFDHPVMVLAATETGHALFGATPLDGQTVDLEPLTGLPIQETDELRGMIYLRNEVTGPTEAHDRLCVFGQGMFCFDGTEWVALMPDASGPPINDVGMLLVDNLWQVLVVGEDGSVRTQGLQGWQTYDIETGEDLYTVSVRGGLFSAAGSGGVLVEGNEIDAVSCHVTQEEIVSINWLGDETLTGITGAGRIFVGQSGGPLRYACQHVPDPLESRFFGCDTSDNFLVLTEEALRGGQECVAPE